MSHDRILIKGNEAGAFGALDAGCRCYFGYPITPQNEIPETMSLRLPECGGQFVQAESEVAAINMLLGAGACGIPAMTSSSSCGISLMQEGISYMAGSHIPAVIVNMENVDKAMARRVVDFLSGCVYALDGDVKKIAQSAYLFCPHNMDIVGDLETLQAEVESYI